MPMPINTSLPSNEAVVAASQRLAGWTITTPVLESAALNRLAGCQLYFKCENLQRTGSFKFRGACNAVAQLASEVGCVATHSSGNHGAALAAAAAERNLAAHVVVPHGANPSKLANIERYGGILHRCEPTQRARELGLEKVAADTGADAVPPYDDARIIAGQGSCALELLEQIDDLDIVIAPVGGGGLVSGTALACQGRARVVGVEPTGADDTWRSLASGQRVQQHAPDTLCDGLRALVGKQNFQLIEREVESVLRIEDADTVAAMRIIWEELKQVVEPSAAITLAGVLRYPERFKGLRVGLILTGGNVDLDQLPWHQ